MPFSLRAGDKIDFSTPSAALDVPQVENDEKEAPQADIPIASPVNRFVAGSVQVSSEVVVVTRPKRKDDRAWDSNYGDDRDSATETDLDSPDSPDSRQKPNRRVDAQREENSYARSAFSQQRSEEAAERQP